MEDKKEKKDLTKEVESLKQQVDNLDTLYKMEKANFLNYKKEESSRIQMYQEMAKLDVLSQLFTVLNSFHASKPMLKGATEEVKKGFDLIQLQITDILKKYEIEEIKKIEVFDPSIHEVVDTVKGKKEGGIVEVISTGYTYKGRVLVPSKIKIIKN